MSTFKNSGVIWHNETLAANYFMCIRGHCKTNIDGADGTFLGLPLAYLLIIKLILSYDPAIETAGPVRFGTYVEYQNREPGQNLFGLIINHIIRSRTINKMITQNSLRNTFKEISEHDLSDRFFWRPDIRIFRESVFVDHE